MHPDVPDAHRRRQLRPANDETDAAHARPLTPGRRHDGATRHGHTMALVSEGWSASGTLPTEATVALTDGETLDVPVNSYQRRITGGSVSLEGASLGTIDTGATVTVTRRKLSFQPLSIDDLNVPACASGLCMTLVEEEGGDYGLAVTAFGTEAAALPEKLEFTVVVDDFGEKVARETFAVAFDDEVTAVFAHEVSFYGDPMGLGLSGKVKLLGPANRKGQQETLAKGKFYGAFSRDADGDLSLAGADKDDVTSTSSVILTGGAVSLTDLDGGALPPPVVPYGNGSGTRPVTTTTSGKPGLR